MNYYKKDNSYIASDLPLPLPAVSAQEYTQWREKLLQKSALMRQLEELDAKSLRSLRAITSGAGTQEDIDRLATLEEQARNLRNQLNQPEVVQ